MLTQKERYAKTFDYFERTMPVVQTELHYGSTFQLIVAVILSAQCTDRRVNMVTPRLFAAYPTAHHMSQASVEEIESYISSVSYPHSKSQHLSSMAKQLCEHYGGEVPNTMEELLTLSGVGRKTANVVLSVAFNQATIAVDTHVFRVSNRIGLTKNSRTPESTERTLMKLIPADKLHNAHHWLILHGRYVCTARKPKCDSCGLVEVCAYYAANNQPTTTGSKPKKRAQSSSSQSSTSKHND